MDLPIAYSFIREHVDLHGLKDWSVKFNKNPEAAAETVHSSRQLLFDMYWVEAATAEQLYEVILHEVAHAQLGPNHGHDNVWRKRVRALGGTPKVSTDAQGREVFSFGRWGVVATLLLWAWMSQGILLAVTISVMMGLYTAHRVWFVVRPAPKFE